MCPDSPPLSVPETNDDTPIGVLLTKRQNKAHKALNWQPFSSGLPVQKLATSPAIAKRGPQQLEAKSSGKKDPLPSAAANCPFGREKDNPSGPGRADSSRRHSLGEVRASRNGSAAQKTARRKSLAGIPEATAAEEASVAKVPLQLQKPSTRQTDPYRCHFPSPPI